MVVISAFGIAKEILTYQGLSAAPATLDWLMGVVLTVVLYWLGQYEAARPPLLPSFFHTDYAPHIVFPILESSQTSNTLFSCASHLVLNIFVLGNVCVGSSLYLIQHASDVDKIIIIILLYGGICVVGLFYIWLEAEWKSISHSVSPKYKRIQKFLTRDHEVNKRVKGVIEIFGIIFGISSAIYLLVWGARVPLVGIGNILVQQRRG